MRINKDKLFDAFATGWKYTVGLVCKYPREAALLGLSIALIVAVA